MKFHVLLIFAAAVLAGMTGCGDNRDYSFSFWHHFFTDQQTILTHYLLDYQKKNPNIKITLSYKVFQEMEDIWNSSEDVALDKMADIMIIPHDRIGQLAQNGFIQPLDELIGRTSGKFLPNNLEAVKYNGHYYGVPLITECIALFYNTALSPVPPADVNDIIKKKAGVDEARGDRFLLTDPVQIAYFAMPWLFSYGGRLFDDKGNPRVNYPANAAAFAKMKALFTKKLGLKYLEENFTTELFKNGKIDYIITGPWNLMAFLASGVKFGVAELPKNDEGGFLRPFMGIQCIAVNKRLGRDEMKQINRILEFLIDSGFGDDMTLSTKYCSSFLKTYENVKVSTDPYIMGFKKQVEKAIPMNNTPKMALVWAAFNNDNLKKIYTENIDIQAFLDKLQAEIDWKLSNR